MITEIVACKQTIKLWEEISNSLFAPLVKTQICTKLFGDKYYGHHSCPCCYFANVSVSLPARLTNNCLTKCPMRGFWSEEEQNNLQENYMCEFFDSPYHLWCHSNASIDAQWLADIAKEALEYWESMRDMNQF